MNIKDTITTMESKLEEIDALFDASQEAEKAGERFKAHGIAKDAEKIAEEIEKLAYEPDEIMERAYSRMGEQDYNLLFNNCENFATWCRCG